MTISEFKHKYHTTQWPDPENCIELLNKLKVKVSAIALVTNRCPKGSLYYTLFSTPNSLRYMSKIVVKQYSLEETTLEELKDRHYRAVDKALEDVGHRDNAFIMHFGWPPPSEYSKPRPTGSILSQKVPRASTAKRYR